MQQEPQGMRLVQGYWKRKIEILPLLTGDEPKEPQQLELKPLPAELKYAFLEENEQCHAPRIPARPDWRVRTEVRGVMLSILYTVYYTVLGLSLTCSFSEVYLYLLVHKQFQ